MTDRDWIKAGAPAREVRYGSSGQPYMHLGTIKRVTARYVIMTSCQRYRLSDLLATTHSDPWNQRGELLPPDHPRVIEYLKLEALRKKIDEIRIAAGTIIRDIDTAEAILSKVKKLLEGESGEN